MDKNNEAILLLKNMDSALVMGLYELYKNKKLTETLFMVLQVMKNVEFNNILKSAGAVNSMDTMVNSTNDISFRRGRISNSVMLESMIRAAGKEVTKRDTKDKDKTYGKSS